MAQLTHRLDDMVQSPNMGLAQQAAMGVDGIAPAQLDLAIRDELCLSTWFAIAQGLQLQENHVGEAVVDLQKIHVFAIDPRHFERARRGVAQADLEGVGTRRDIVGGVRMPFSRTGDAHGNMRHVPGAVHSRNHDCAGPVSLQTAIVEAKGFGYPARGMVGFGIQFPAISEGLRIHLRMATARQCNGRHRFRADIVNSGVPGGEPGIHLHRQEHAIRNVIALDRIRQGVHVHRPRRRCARLGPQGGITVPPERHQHMVA